MMVKDIKLGFVGLGYIGTIHATACFAMPLIFKKLPFKIKFGPVYKNNIDDIPYFFEGGVKNIDELLKDNELNAVDICTPNYLHKMQAVEVMKKGLNIYLEKPIGLNSDEAFELMNMAKEKNVINQAALMYRFMPAINQARDLINNGEIGDILNFKALMLHSGYLNPKRPMSWKMRFDTSGGGAVIDLGIHLVDAIRFMLGEVKMLQARSETYFKKRPTSNESDSYEEVDVDDWTEAYFKMHNGAWGTVETSRISADIEEETRFEIYGTKGSIKISTKQPRYAFLYKKDENQYIVGNYREKSTFSKYVDTIYPDPKYSLGFMVDMHMASLMNFFLNIVEDKIVYKETPTFEEAYKSQLIIDKIIESAKNDSVMIEF
ncbi:dehydrogenase [Thermoanaerobacterium thermosaccharolyticum]|uniref:Dehydrogenase n=1 Tax=Thermoanaerobacterium thermosaccharolyticum TaxID=1517 RepID=A0A231VNZ2_THETR|nr:Gfo/Idh/MocA family oxidoreductase [Thermoanaerobacterium thermosaccharolyticum]OXT09436.1 dehydrogenase [Thermoanaerobacterium thermosaccharolyticum]